LRFNEFELSIENIGAQLRQTFLERGRVDVVFYLRRVKQKSPVHKWIWALPVLTDKDEYSQK